MEKLIALEPKMNLNASSSVHTLLIIAVQTLDSVSITIISVMVTMTVRMEKMKEIVEDLGLEKERLLLIKINKMSNI